MKKRPSDIAASYPFCIRAGSLRIDRQGVLEKLFFCVARIQSIEYDGCGRLFFRPRSQRTADCRKPAQTQ